MIYPAHIQYDHERGALRIKRCTVIDKLQTIEDKSGDIILFHNLYEKFYGIIEDDIHLTNDGDLIIDIS